MPYPPAQPPGGYNPYEDIPPADPPQVETPAAVTPPGYPAGPPHPPGSGPAQMPDYSIWTPAPATAEKNGLGTGALVTGILSIVMCALAVIGAILGIIAVTLGASGVRRAREGRANNPGVAMAGLITGAVGTALGVVWSVLILIGALAT